MTTHGSATLVCPSCGHKPGETTLASECGQCGALLDLVVSCDLRPADLRTLWASRATVGKSETSGVWRYREMVEPTMSMSAVVSYPEGNTPVIDNERIAKWCGVPSLSIKHEGMNPTGSFKDRGMTVALSQAKRIGATSVACASTGNTSASLAAYAALAGLPAIVLVPAGKIASGKLAQTIAHGARVITVRGTFDDCLRMLREAGESLGVYVANSVNPFRLAGQRSIVFELLHQLDWKAPDWIVLPAGNLGNTSAFGAALEAARGSGLIDRVPRIASIQASGAAPFAAAFADDFKSHPTVQPETVASAIRIGAPASWDRAIRAIRYTNGIVATVTDEEILDAKRRVDEAGVGCEPASAASVAGIRKLRSTGVIRPADRVVAVLTGHVLKDPDVAMRGRETPVEIDPTVKALEEAMAR